MEARRKPVPAEVFFDSGEYDYSDSGNYDYNAYFVNQDGRWICYIRRAASPWSRPKPLMYFKGCAYLSRSRSCVS